jgi:hypothetical protein
MAHRLALEAEAVRDQIWIYVATESGNEEIVHVPRLRHAT